MKETLPNKVKVRVTKNDLKKAIKAMEQGETRSNYCLVAQSARRLFKRDVAVSFTGRIWLSEDLVNYLDGDKAKELVDLFDNHEYTALEKMLPLTLEYKKEEI